MEQIFNPNSSGQGFCPSHSKSPFSTIAERFGYRYSHSTRITRLDGTSYVWHSYRHGEHTLGFRTDGQAWNTSGSCASGRHTTGVGEYALAKHLASKRKRYKLAA